MKRIKKHALLVISICLGGVVVMLAAMSVWYSAAIPADAAKLAAAQSRYTVTYADVGPGIVVKPVLPATRSIVLYPAGRVDPAAYAYKMSNIAEHGVAVIIVKPPLNLPPLAVRSLSDYKKYVPEATEWYAAGHAIGGIKACHAVSKDASFKGLILLGSYCFNHIEDTQLRVLSVAGGADTRTTQADIDARKDLLPPSATYAVITGLSHDGFGDYGDMLTSDAATAHLSRLITQFVGAPYK